MAAKRRRPYEDDPELWAIEFEPAAEEEIARLYGSVQRDALETIESLRHDPDLGGSMRRYNNYYRLYFGNDRFRLVYQVNRRTRTIRIVRARPRPTAYKGMKNP